MMRMLSDVQKGNGRCIPQPPPESIFFFLVKSDPGDRRVARVSLLLDVYLSDNLVSQGFGTGVGSRQKSPEEWEKISPPLAQKEE